MGMVIIRQKILYIYILIFLITIIKSAREIEGFSSQCMIFPIHHPCLRSYSGLNDLNGHKKPSQLFPTSSSALRYTENPSAQTDTLENHPDWKAYIDSNVKGRIIYFNIHTGETFFWNSSTGKSPFTNGFCPKNQQPSQRNPVVDEKQKSAFERDFANGSDQQSSYKEPVVNNEVKKQKHTFERDFKKSSFASAENGANSYKSGKNGSRNWTKEQRFDTTSYKTVEEFPWDSHPSVHPFENVNSEYTSQDNFVSSNESKKYDFFKGSKRNSYAESEDFADSRKWTNSGTRDPYKYSYKNTSNNSNSFNQRFQFRKKRKEPLQGIAYWEFYVEDELVSHFVVQTAESLQKARGWTYNGRKHSQKKKNVYWDPFTNF